MKKLITLLLVLVTLNGYSQMSEFTPFKPYRGEYNYIDWPMYSKVWRLVSVGEYDANGMEVVSLQPKEGRYNSFKNDWVNENLDVEIVKSHLHTSFNEFRSDYGLSPVKENVDITNRSQDYSVELFDDFKHSDYKEGNYLECIGSFALLSIYSLKEGEDVNKIISECCFDLFVGSAGHMAMLLKEDNNYEYGYGITIFKNVVKVVIQAEKTP